MNVRWSPVLCHILGTVVVFGGFRVHSQDLTEVRPAYDLRVGTVQVAVWGALPSGERRYLELRNAAAFLADGCGVVTPFSTVQKYEQWETRDDLQRSITIFIAGRSYPGRLRHVGVLPLACIDFGVPPEDRPYLLPFEVETRHIAGLVLKSGVRISLDLLPGTPYIDDRGEVAGIAAEHQVIRGEVIRDFLQQARAVPDSGWPRLRSRRQLFSSLRPLDR